MDVAKPAHSTSDRMDEGTQVIDLGDAGDRAEAA